MTSPTPPAGPLTPSVPTPHRPAMSWCRTRVRSDPREGPAHPREGTAATRRRAADSAVPAGVLRPPDVRPVGAGGVGKLQRPPEAAGRRLRRALGRDLGPRGGSITSYRSTLLRMPLTHKHTHTLLLLKRHPAFPHFSPSHFAQPILSMDAKLHVRVFEFHLLKVCARRLLWLPGG
jgi:hypothetical protein